MRYRQEMGTRERQKRKKRKRKRILIRGKDDKTVN